MIGNFITSLYRGVTFVAMAFTATILPLLLTALLASLFLQIVAMPAELRPYASSGSALVAALIFYVLVFRLARRSDQKESGRLYAYSLRAAAVFSICVLATTIAAALLDAAKVIEFSKDGVDRGNAVDHFMLTIDNLAKVMLFDVLEVFEINLTLLKPEDAGARTFVVLSRILYSYAIVRSLFAILSTSVFERGVSMTPSWGAVSVVVFSYAALIGLLYFAFF